VGLDYATPEKRDHSARARLILKCVACLVVCAIALGFLLPSLNRTSNCTSQGKCASNLHQIGLAIQLYENDYHSGYPDCLATLLVTEQITPVVLICPDSTDTPTTAPADQQAADLAKPGHLSYLYLGQGFNAKTVAARQVIACEPLAFHGNGIDVLLGDGQVEFVDLNRAKKILAGVKAAVRPVILPP